jgi:hypothetical protein
MTRRRPGARPGASRQGDGEQGERNQEGRVPSGVRETALNGPEHDCPAECHRQSGKRQGDVALTLGNDVQCKSGDTPDEHQQHGDPCDRHAHREPQASVRLKAAQPTLASTRVGLPSFRIRWGVDGQSESCNSS